MHSRVTRSTNSIHIFNSIWVWETYQHALIQMLPTLLYMHFLLLFFSFFELYFLFRNYYYYYYSRAQSTNKNAICVLFLLMTALKQKLGKNALVVISPRKKTRPVQKNMVLVSSVFNSLLRILIQFENVSFFSLMVAIYKIVFTMQQFWIRAIRNAQKSGWFQKKISESIWIN